MPPGRPHVGRASYIRIKLRQETHQSWVGMKRLLKVKSDDALARHLLAHFAKTPVRMVANRNATEANHASSSSNRPLACKQKYFNYFLNCGYVTTGCSGCP